MHRHPVVGRMTKVPRLGKYGHPVTNNRLPLDLPVHVRFPQAGRYTVQVWFFQETSADVLKMEQPFYVLEAEA